MELCNSYSTLLCILSSLTLNHRIQSVFKVRVQVLCQRSLMTGLFFSSLSILSYEFLSHIRQNAMVAFQVLTDFLSQTHGKPFAVASQTIMVRGIGRCFGQWNLGTSSKHGYRALCINPKFTLSCLDHNECEAKRSQNGRSYICVI